MPLFARLGAGSLTPGPASDGPRGEHGRDGPIRPGGEWRPPAGRRVRAGPRTARPHRRSDLPNVPAPGAVRDTPRSWSYHYGSNHLLLKHRRFESDLWLQNYLSRYLPPRWHHGVRGPSGCTHSAPDGSYGHGHG